jgi:hypothetical protein
MTTTGFGEANHQETCPSCKAPAVPSVSSTGRVAKRLARIFVLACAWTVILGFGAALAILIPINLILIPCWLMVGSSLGPLARELFDPKCARCLDIHGAGAANVSRRSARPTNKGSMEGCLVGEAQ